MPSSRRTSDASISRLFYFFLAGGTGFALYLVISNTLHYEVGLAEVPSAVAGTLLSILPTFWMQRHLTFRSVAPHRRSLPRYALLQVFNAMLIGALSALGSRLDLPAVATFCVAGVIGTVVSYIVQAKVVFPV
jgi:putative flippase GtrA